MVINILSNRSEWTFYFLSSVQFNFTISENNILLSTSYGDFNSQLLIFKNKLNKPNYNLDLSEADKAIILSPYME